MCKFPIFKKSLILLLISLFSLSTIAQTETLTKKDSIEAKNSELSKFDTFNKKGGH